MFLCYNSYVQNNSLNFNRYTFKMSSHGYHTRNNTPPTENQTPHQSNNSTDQSSNDVTSLIASLESKLYFALIICLQSFLILKMLLLKI